jgi:transcriptional regulator with XRE-family HTH domain
METIKMIGKFIKRERTKQKLSLAQLSKKSFGSQFQAKGISLIERGLVPNVSFVTIDKILVALGYELKDLFRAD